MNRRRVIVIVIVIVGVLIAGAGAYFAWQKSQQILNPPVAGARPVIPNQIFTNNNLGNNSSNQGQANQPNASKLKVLTGTSISGYWLFNTTTTSRVYYVGEDGKIFRKTLPLGGNNQNENISSEALPNIREVKASLDGKFALFKYGDLVNPQFSLFAVDAKIWQDLPNISAAAFSPDSKKIAYLENPKSAGLASSLIAKDLIGKKPSVSKIISLREKDFNLVWPVADKIFLTGKPSFEYESQIWSVSLSKKTLSLVSFGRGLTMSWSSDGKSGLQFTTTQDRSSRLALTDGADKILANLDFLTLPEKCLFEQFKIYCAIPQFYNSPIAPTLPDDYLRKAVYSNDYIYAINTTQNNVQSIFAGGNQAVDATHLGISGKQLFFINRYDNKLYSLDL